MTDLTEQEVCIGSLGQQKVYLNWSDVKDICTNAVSVAYEQTKIENTKLKEQLDEYKRLADMRGKIIARMEDSDNDREKFQNKKIAKLKELLKECDRMNTTLQNALWQWNEESDLYEECDALEAKINQALGEDK